ncbi:MAG: extracellular solute-binding protein [Burkholderiaceae bacterium]|nr:extracellular solute-binding protein [Burkholderiaceae bacterium]
MKTMTSRAIGAALAISASLLASAAQAGTITVITSFPKELTQAYKSAFEKKNPDIKVEILNKNTTAAIATIREAADGQRPDVMWASAPDAFEVLSRNKLLAPAKGLANPDAPEKVGSFPLNDPEGMYLGQAIAGYGLMWNTRYMAAHKLPKPAEWGDLAKPVYFGHVAMSSPSRSGTTHLTVETILQAEGWDKGWSQLLQVSGNMAAITDRSFGVPDGVNNGQFGIGLVIDFFGLAGRYSGFPVEFVYPTRTAVVPANIALVAGGRNAEEAKKFIQFSLSEEGQLLLLDPKISRLPILPKLYSHPQMPKDYPNAFEIAKRAKVNFNNDLSGDRYFLVVSLFDQTVTFRLKDLQAATRAIHEAEAKWGGKPSGDAARLIKEARDLAYTPIVGEKLAGDKNYLALFTKSKKDAAVTKQLSALEEQWSTKARANSDRATEVARQAVALKK